MKLLTGRGAYPGTFGEALRVNGKGVQPQAALVEFLQVGNYRPATGELIL